MKLNYTNIFISQSRQRNQCIVESKLFRTHRRVSADQKEGGLSNDLGQTNITFDNCLSSIAT